MKKTLYRVLSMMLVVAMGLSLAACGADSTAATTAATETATEVVTEAAAEETEAAEESTAETAAETEAAAADSSKIADSLNIGTAQLWATLSPFQTTQNQYGNFVRLLYDRMAYIYNGEYVPQMAESWEVADDGVTWTVKIHDNITDSEGNHITADDIVWFTQESMSRALKPVFNKVQEVSKIDDYTIQFVMKSQVVGTFELVLASVYGVSKTAFEASEDEFAKTVVSSGPYKVVEYVAGSHLTLELREDYWNKDETNPALQNNVKNVTYTIITEASQQQIALETGNVDCFESLTSSLVSAFEGSSDYGNIVSPSGNGIQMYFSGDASRPCGKSEDLCKAIAYCIDMSGVLTAAYEGRGTVMKSGASQMLVGYNTKWDSEPYFEYNVDTAKEYLEKSGYNGEELILVASSGGGSDLLTQVLQTYMLAIGINCKISLLDSALMASMRFDGSQYDMILVQAGGITITNWWGVRFDMNAYEKGDGTARKDETLTQLIYDSWTTAGYNEESIDAVNSYLNEHCYVYGLVNPDVNCVYRTDTGIVSAPVNCQGIADFVSAVFQ